MIVANEKEIFIDKLYKLLVDQSPFQVTFFDLDLNLLYVNEYTCKFNGKELDEIKGTPVLEFMLPKERENFKELICRIGPDHPADTIENQNLDKNGKLHWVLWHNRGIFNSNGELIGYLSLGQDITRKKEIENDLALSRDRLKEAQTIGRLGGWEWDIMKDTTYWSEETFHLLNLEDGEIEPNQEFYRNCIISEDRDKIIQHHERLFKHNIEIFNIEYRLCNKNSKVLWIRDRGKIYYHNGKAVKITGTILDITESKELQISLEEHIAIENTLLEISNTFMFAEKEKTGLAIKNTLKILGSRFGADRAYLILPDSGFGETYEWTSDKNRKSEDRWKGSMFETPALYETLNKKKKLAIPFAVSWPYEKDYNWFKKNRIGAFLAVSFHNNNKDGYLCIDNTEAKPEWKNIDFSFLEIAGEMCINARETIKTRNEIVRKNELLSVTLMSIADGFILLAPDGQIEMINKSAIQLLGLGDRILQGEYFEDVIHLTDPFSEEILMLNTFKHNLKKENIHRECLYQHPDGIKKTLSYSCTLIPDPGMNGDGLALIFRDVSEEIEKQKEIAYMSFHDSLTGLYNRAFMDTELKRMDTIRQLPLSIITGDLNGLKLVNDVFGHEEGDKLIVTIGKILLSCCREEDIISRWGGDEFSIILPCTDQKGADRICERIRKKCERPKDTRIVPSIALGSATKTSPIEDINNILREAEDRMYRQKLLDDRSVRSDIISSLKNSMFEKSFETEEHTQRMLKITERFGKELELPMNRQSDLNLLAIMHDMGKIAVPTRILGKPGKLSEEEWEEIKKHPGAGFRIAQSSQKLAGIADLILSHHERWDGKGYPRGLKGLEIPELARIISIVDTYDVMTNGRVYKEGVSSQHALEEIKRCSGTQFDPDFSERFIKMMQKEQPQ